MNQRQNYRLGMSSYNAGRYAEAIEYLVSVTQKGVGARKLLSRFYLARSHHELGVQLFKDRQYDRAALHFQEAARLNPRGGGLAGFLAACYVHAERYDLAADELTKICESEPDNVEVRIRLGLSQYKQGSPLQAVATLREGLSRLPDHPELNYQLGVLLASQDEIEEAQRSFEKTLALAPAHVGALERLAQCAGVAGRSERAMECLQQAHKLDPSNSRIALQVSILVRSKVGMEQAKVFSSGARPQMLDEKSIQQLGEAIIKEPDFVETFLSLPGSEVDEEVFSTLAAILERAMAKYPEYADLHYHCGEVYRRLGRSEDAIAHAEQAVRINPRYVNALIFLARLYGQTDQYAAGVDRLEQAIDHGGDYPDVHYLLGRLSQKACRWDRARQAYRRALDLKKDYHKAREALAALPS